jgi:predicted acyltransferase
MPPSLRAVVFPWFIFMSGVSSALALSAERKRGATARQLVYRGVARAVKLWLIGAFIVNNPRISPPPPSSVLGYFSFPGLVLALVDALLPALAPEASTSSNPILAALWVDFGRYAPSGLPRGAWPRS